MFSIIATNNLYLENGLFLYVILLFLRVSGKYCQTDCKTEKINILYIRCNKQRQQYKILIGKTKVYYLEATNIINWSMERSN